MFLVKLFFINFVIWTEKPLELSVSTDINNTRISWGRIKNILAHSRHNQQIKVLGYLNVNPNININKSCRFFLEEVVVTGFMFQWNPLTSWDFWEWHKITAFSLHSFNVSSFWDLLCQLPWPLQTTCKGTWLASHTWIQITAGKFIKWSDCTDFLVKQWHPHAEIQFTITASAYCPLTFIQMLRYI